MTRYVALISTPGYLPWDDDPPVFDTPFEAWIYLEDERKYAEDQFDDGSSDAYTDTVDILHKHAHDGVGIGTVYGSTPGYDGSHDLGLAYSVAIDEEWIES